MRTAAAAIVLALALALAGAADEARPLPPVSPRQVASASPAQYPAMIGRQISSSTMIVSVAAEPDAEGRRRVVGVDTEGRQMPQTEGLASRAYMVGHTHVQVGFAFYLPEAQAARLIADPRKGSMYTVVGRVRRITGRTLPSGVVELLVEVDELKR